MTGFVTLTSSLTNIVILTIVRGKFESWKAGQVGEEGNGKIGNMYV